MSNHFTSYLTLVNTKTAVYNDDDDDDDDDDDVDIY